MGVFDPYHFTLISPYSNWAVQIRVGLEPAEFVLLLKGHFRDMNVWMWFEPDFLKAFGLERIPLMS